MNSDDSMRNTHYSSNRKPGMSKSQGYSPSMNYNYNGNQTQHGNHGNSSSHGNHSNHGNSNYNSQQNPRRKQPFKRDNHGSNNNDRLFKQNDIIIRLLKEIRDRLPAPPVTETENQVQGEVKAESTIPKAAAPAPVAEAKEPVPVAGVKKTAPKKNQKTPVAIAEDDEDLDTLVNGNV